MKLRITFLIASLCLLAGCSKLTKENYELLELGMSKQEVEAVIGSPDKCTDSMTTLKCVWGKEEGTYISVSFTADKAVLFGQGGLE